MTEIQSLIFYYILFVTIMISACYIQKQDKLGVKLIEINALEVKARFSHIIPLLILYLLPAAVAGIRYGIGTDYFGYLKIFEATPEWNGLFVNADIYRIELLSYSVAYFVSKIGGNFHVYLFVTALFTYGLAIRALRKRQKNDGFDLMVFIYFCMCYASSFNVVRQTMAMSVVLMGIHYIYDDKIFKYIAFVLLAMMFHISAVFCLLFVFLNPKGKYGKLKSIAFTCLFLLIPILIQHIYLLFSKFSIFSTLLQYGYQHNRIHWQSLIIRLPIAGLIFIFSNRLVEKDAKNRFLISLYVMEYVAFFMSSFNAWAFRFMSYAYISEVLLIPQLVDCVNVRGKKIMRIGILIYYAVFFFVMYYRGGTDEIFPYQVFWNS